MADVVLRERLVVAGAAVAALFLIVLLLVAAFVLLAHMVDRYRRTDAKQEEFLAQTLPELDVPVAVVDTRPGIDLALADECALILAATNEHEADLAAGLDRLRDAVRNQQQKGETP